MLQDALRLRGCVLSADGTRAQCPTHEYHEGDDLALIVSAQAGTPYVSIECAWGCGVEGIIEVLGLTNESDAPLPYLWPPIEEFETTPPPLPLLGLPGPLKDLVIEGAEALQVPTDLVLNHALGMLSSAPYGTVEVKIKEGWVVPLQLATLSLAGSGEKKSPTNKLISKPFSEVETNRIRRDYTEGLEREAAIETEILRLETLKSAATKNAKSAAQSGGQQDWSEVEASKRKLMELEGKHLKWSSVMDDATPEYVGVQLGSTYTGAALMVSDETSIFGHIAGNGRGVTGTEKAKVYLQGISGDPILTGRLGRAGESAPRPALSLAVMLQPELFEKIVRATPELVTSGIVPRMLIVRPKSRVGMRSSRTHPITEGTLQRWAAAVKGMCGAADDYVNSILDERRREAEKDPTAVSPLEQVSPRTMEVTLAGTELIAKYQDSVEPEMMDNGRLAPIAAWISKSATYIVQIAAILTLVDEPFAVEVDIAYMAVAEDLVRTYAEHQLRLAEVPTETAAERLWIRLRELDDSKFDESGWMSFRDVRRLVQNQSWYKNAELRAREQALEEATDTLEARGFIRKAEGKRKDQFKIMRRPA